MKNISEVAVGLAYSALVLRDQGLAAEVRHLEDRLDEMKDRLELWVLRASNDRIDPAPLRGLLHLSQAAEDLGDAAQQMVWLIEEKEELHPILSIALGDSDEVVVRVPVGAGLRGRRRHRSPSCSSTSSPASTCSPCRRGGRYLYRPARPRARSQAGDELIASGPDEGHPMLAAPLRLAPHRGRGHRRARPRAPRPLRSGTPARRGLRCSRAACTAAATRWMPMAKAAWRSGSLVLLGERLGEPVGALHPVEQLGVEPLLLPR